MDLRFIVFTFLIALISLISCDDSTTTTSTTTTTTTTTTPSTTTTSSTTTTPSTTTVSESEKLKNRTEIAEKETKKRINATIEEGKEVVEQFKNRTLEIKNTLIHSPLASALNSVFKWADDHFPLTVKILQVAKTLSDTQLEQIPGAKIFLEILSDATHWHMVKEKLRPGQDFKNHTIEKVVEEFSRHHNYTLKDIPFLNNITDKITSIPAVKDLTKTALTTNVNGVPFALTLVFLMQHLGTQIPLSQFTNATVQAEIIKRVSNDFQPFLKIQYNRTINKVKNHTHKVIANLTDFGEYQVNKAGEIVTNISDHILGNIKNTTSLFVDYSGNSLNRTKILNKLVANMTQKQWEDMITFMKRTREVPGRIFESPLNGVSFMANNALDMVRNTFGKVTDFTQWLNLLTWSHLEDLGSTAGRARDIGMNNIYHAQHLTMGMARHAYNTALNLSDLTMKMSPLEIFKFKSVDDLAKNKAKNKSNDGYTEPEGFFTRMPIVGRLPGVTVVQGLFNQFPQFSLLNFDQTMKLFDVFRSK